MPSFYPVQKHFLKCVDIFSRFANISRKSSLLLVRYLIIMLGNSDRKPLFRLNSASLYLFFEK